MKRAVITGGVGFLGSQLARSLIADEVEVIIIDCRLPGGGANDANIPDHPLITMVRADIREIGALAPILKDADALFHCAAQTSHAESMTDPYTDLDINVRGSLSVLEACRQYNQKIPIVICGTRQIYGIPDYLPVNELHPLRPPDVNGINKRAVEDYGQLYSRVHGLRI